MGSRHIIVHLIRGEAKDAHEAMTRNLVEKLDAFLKFNEYDILKDAGKVKSSVAKSFAEKQYEKFRVIQDKEYKSDFDKIEMEYNKLNNPTS